MGTVTWEPGIVIKAAYLLIEMTRPPAKKSAPPVRLETICRPLTPLCT
jgi:hypothetical protein